MERSVDESPRAELRTLFVGDAARAEFRAAAEALAATTHCTFAATLDVSRAGFDDGEPLDLIVVAQASPGSFSAAELDRLRRRAPLARVIALLGSWCEGEMRSGTPLTATVRVFWHEWDAWWRQELARVATGRCPAWGLPVTATDDERLLFAADAAPAELRGTVGIAAGFETAVCWGAMCRGLGLSTVFLASHDAPPRRERHAVDIVLFDADGSGGATREALVRFARSWRGTPLVAVLDFPRIEDREELEAAGAAAVLSRPLGVSDLRWQIERLLHAPAVGE